VNLAILFRRETKMTELQQMRRRIMVKMSCFLLATLPKHLYSPPYGRPRMHFVASTPVVRLLQFDPDE
jgi:hypothetical protein